MKHLNSSAGGQRSRKRVIIDTDPGIDDAAAILMALGAPELQVDALTTVFGNASIVDCTLNALRVLEAASRPDISVYRGVGRPFNFKEPAFAPHIHGADGLGNSNLEGPALQTQYRHAVLEIIDRVLGSPGEITFVCLGRQTNLALAISVEPRVAAALKEVVVMGGAMNVPGNATPVASANIWGDPEAADIVYRSGAKIVQVGLDVCNLVEISAEEQQRVWLTKTPASKLLENATPFIIEAYRRDNRLLHPDGVKYNDVTAMAYVVEPSLFERKELYVRIETHGSLTRGQTVADQTGVTGQLPNVTMAVDVKARRLAELWVHCLEELGSDASKGGETPVNETRDR